MNVVILDPTEPGLTPLETRTPEAVDAEQDSASFQKAVQTRESTITSLIQEILQVRPSSHWGINE